MAAKMDKEKKKCISPKFRASFPHLFEAHSGFENQEPKYSLTMLFDKKTDLKELKRIVANAAAEKWGADRTKWPKALRLPFRDGDEKSDLQGYEGTIFCNATSKQRPGVVDKDLSAIAKDDQPGFYAGCYARASLMAFAYDKMGNKGVSFALQNVQKLDEGESFSGRKAADQEFDAVEDTSESEDSYSDKADDDYDLGDE